MFDECLGKPVMDAVKTSQIGQNVEIALVTEEYHAGIGDEIWLPRIASEGNWVVITADKGKSPKYKLPQLCLEFGITHILVSQSIFKLKSERKKDIILFAWDEIMSIANHKQGSRFSLKLKSTKVSSAISVKLDLVEPNKKANNVIETLFEKTEPFHTQER